MFESEKSSYIVLEHLKGGDLFDYLKHRHFQIKERRVKELVRQIGEGLKFLH